MGSERLWNIYHKVRMLAHRRRHDSAQTLNSEKNLQGKFCFNPFSQLDIYEDGKLYSCCTAWLPTALGSIWKQPVAEAWNSPDSQAIRSSILDGSFRYCNHLICPHIQDGSLPDIEEARSNPVYRNIIDNNITRLDTLPVFINLCNDASCNLSCPSCRRQQILHTKGKEYQKRQTLQDLIKSQLFSTPTDREFRINITGSGDPFASPVFREFLFNLDGKDFPNLSIHLQTNGVLLTLKNWNRMHKIHQNIAIVLVSFDAATEATYQITRRGGHWPTLIKNMEALGQLRRNSELRLLRMDFVVQAANFREMPEFIALAKNLNADKAAFSMVLDWGTWTPAVYRKQCIWKQDHPQFEDFIKVLEDPIFDDPMVALGNLWEYRALAKKRMDSSGSRIAITLN